MAQKENGELCQSPVAHLPILFDVHGGSFRDRRGKLPSASWNVCVVGIIFKWKNLYFCQQICCLLCCEYWIMVTQTTDSTGEKSGWETLRFIYFLINWIFPFEKHETSLGIFGVKPEVFHFFGRFLFTLSIEVLFFILAMIKSIRAEFVEGWQRKNIRWKTLESHIEYLSTTTFPAMKFNVWNWNFLCTSPGFKRVADCAHASGKKRKRKSGVSQQKRNFPNS